MSIKYSICLIVFLNIIAANAHSATPEELDKLMEVCQKPSWQKELDWAQGNKNKGISLENGLSVMKNDLYSNPIAKNYTKQMMDQMYLFKKLAWDTVYNSNNLSKYEITQKYTNNCFLELSTANEGTKSHKVAKCKREANSIYQFASARDKGATLSQGKASIRRHAPKLKSKMEKAFGIKINIDDFVKDMDKQFEYVFRNQHIEPKEISSTQYNKCMSE